MGPVPGIDPHLIEDFVGRHIPTENLRKSLVTFESPNSKFRDFGVWYRPLVLHFGQRLHSTMHRSFCCEKKWRIVFLGTSCSMLRSTQPPFIQLDIDRALKRSMPVPFVARSACIVQNYFFCVNMELHSLLFCHVYCVGKTFTANLFRHVRR